MKPIKFNITDDLAKLIQDVYRENKSNYDEWFHLEYNGEMYACYIQYYYSVDCETIASADRDLPSTKITHIKFWIHTIIMYDPDDNRIEDPIYDEFKIKNQLK